MPCPSSDTCRFCSVATARWFFLRGKSNYTIPTKSLLNPYTNPIKKSHYMIHFNPFYTFQIDPVLPHLMRYCVILGRTEELARRRRSEDCGLVQSVPVPLYCRKAALLLGMIIGRIEWLRIRVSRNGDTPIAGGFTIENPIKMDDLRVPPFQEMPK